MYHSRDKHKSACQEYIAHDLMTRAVHGKSVHVQSMYQQYDEIRISRRIFILMPFMKFNAVPFMKFNAVPFMYTCTIHAQFMCHSCAAHVPLMCHSCTIHVNKP